MDMLINLPAISNDKDLKALRQLSNDSLSIEANVRALESLACKPDMASCFYQRKSDWIFAVKSQKVHGILSQS